LDRFVAIVMGFKVDLNPAAVERQVDAIDTDETCDALYGRIGA
jgi:hypothetical protein